MKKALIFLILITVISCKSKIRRAILTEEFQWGVLRSIPSSILTFEKQHGYEIAYQANKDLSEEYNYPDRYVMGKLNKSKDGFKYITSIQELSPFSKSEYVEAVLSHFESDSTYADILVKEVDSLRVCVYQKVKNSDSYAPEYAMWKWEQTVMDSLNFEVIEEMNQHLFMEKKLELSQKL